jgi:hypothetical protein
LDQIPSHVVLAFPRTTMEINFDEKSFVQDEKRYQVFYQQNSALKFLAFFDAASFSRTSIGAKNFLLFEF